MARPRRVDSGGVLRPGGTGAAEELAIQPGVAARVAGHDGAVEVGGPFPDEPVEIEEPLTCRQAGSDARQLGGGRRGIPVPQGTLEFGIAIAVDAGRAGGSGVFPLGHRRQASAFPLGEGFRGEPGNPHDGLVGLRGGIELQIPGPMLEIILIGEESLHLGTSPARIGADEFEEVSVRDWEPIQKERLHRNRVRLAGRNEERSMEARPQRNHAHRSVRRRQGFRAERGGECHAPDENRQAEQR